MRKEWVVAIGGMALLAGCATKPAEEGVMTNAQLQAELTKQREEWAALKPQIDRVLSLEADLKLVVDSIELPPTEDQVLEPSPSTSNLSNRDTSEEVLLSSPSIVPSAALAQADASASSASTKSPTSPSSKDKAPEVANNKKKASADPIGEGKPFQDSPPNGAVVARFYKPETQETYYAVQLAAYASEYLAKQGWRKVSQAHPDVFVDVAPRIKKVSVNGKEYYQLKVGPFLKSAYSNDFCNRLKQMDMDCLQSRYDGAPFMSL